MKIKKYLSIFLFSVGLIALIGYAYWNMFNSFFLQDEWLGFASYLFRQNNGGFQRYFLDSIFLSGSIHVIPLAIAFQYIQLKFFALNFFSYALVSIANHILNTFLVILLSNKLLKNKYLALSVGILFGLSSISSQSIIWIATSVNTLPAASFAILSIFFFQKYIEDIKNKNKYLYISFGMFFISLFFKETTVFLFLFFPLCWFVFKKDFNLKYSKKLFLTLSIIGIIYVFIREIFLLTEPTVPALVSKSFTNPNYATYAYRLFSYPLKIISQSIIPQNLLLSLSRGLVFIAYPQYFVTSDAGINPYVAESIAYDVVSYVISILILVLSYSMYLFFSKREKRIATVIPFSLLLVCLSSLPFIFIGGVAGYSSILEPRHLYISIIGISLLAAVSLYGIFSWFIHNQKITKIGILLCVFVLAIASVKIIRGEVRTISIASGIRKTILNTIYGKYPSFSPKTIFYVESSKAFYGLAPEEKILPFQSGFGQVLLVWYKAHNVNIPSCFFENNYLYAIESEGYRECGGRGFGYFRKYQSLTEFIGENNVSLYKIIAFSYNADTQTLSDITSEIRQDLNIKK